MTIFVIGRVCFAVVDPAFTLQAFPYFQCCEFSRIYSYFEIQRSLRLVLIAFSPVQFSHLYILYLQVASVFPTCIYYVISLILD